MPEQWQNIVEEWTGVIREAAAVVASDVFWKPNNPPWMRIKGVVHPQEQWPVMQDSDMEALARHLMGERDWERFQDYPEKDIGLTVDDVARLRINIYKERGHVSMVSRLIPLEIPTVDDLGLPEVLKTIAERPHGLVLVTGPTGCGKSTTLAAMIDHINRRRRTHIVSIEDPIEFVHQDRMSIVSQREVSIDTEGFLDALKYVMRQNPDVILIGEMRDVETFNAAMQAAETGHLVFSTVHTTSASETMERILNMFPPHEREQVSVRLSRSLQAVVSQALVPRAHEEGRIAALEVMVVTPTVQKYIEEGRAGDVDEAIEEGAHWGMQTKNQALLDFYGQDIISADAAIFNAHNASQMRQMIRRFDKVQSDEEAERERQEKEKAKREARRRGVAQNQAQPSSEGEEPPSAPPAPPGPSSSSA